MGCEPGATLIRFVYIITLCLMGVSWIFNPTLATSLQFLPENVAANHPRFSHSGATSFRSSSSGHPNNVTCTDPRTHTHTLGFQTFKRNKTTEMVVGGIPTPLKNMRDSLYGPHPSSSP